MNTKVPYWLFVFSVALMPLFALAAEEVKTKVWEQAPPQPVYSRFQRNMGYQHDRGFFFEASVGPAWVQSFQNPVANGVRFSGDISMGGLPWEDIALHGTLWGAYLAESSVILVGPGLTGFLANNWALSASIGVGYVFSGGTDQLPAFRESILGLQIKGAKYWWVSSNLSMGVSLAAELHGFSFLQGEISSVGFSAGPRFELVFN